MLEVTLQTIAECAKIMLLMTLHSLGLEKFYPFNLKLYALMINVFLRKYSEEI